MSAASDPAVVTALTTPVDGVPGVVDDPAGLADAERSLAGGSGPVAIDTERAQSYRYSAKAYLLQFRRAGSGTHLLDPVAFENGEPRADLSSLGAALADAEWIVHAATQDLPCLAELNLLPRTLFDTELAGRLLGLPRVSLGALLEHALGVSLAKEHSAADWSQRPLPTDWLAYAALDVELLVELRDWAAAELREAGKDEWARQEFDHLVAHAGDPVEPRLDPWRRATGLHAVRSRRGLGIVRELWLVRDEVARTLDRAPGKILSDRAMTELAVRLERPHAPAIDRAVLRGVNGFTWRQAARHEALWLDAVARALAAPPSALPVLRPPAEGPPAPRSWGSRHPDAAARWSRVRPAVVALAEELGLPPENLVSPDAIRRLAWQPPADLDEESLDAFLAGHGVREWQRGLVTPVVLPLLAEGSVSSA